jgi:hypothetical protein
MAHAKKSARKAAIKSKAIRPTPAKNKSKTVVATKGLSKPTVKATKKKPPRSGKARPPAVISKAAESKTHAPPVVSLPPIPHELIARRATEIWAEKMRIANDSTRNWQEAEAELRAAQTK